MSERGVESCRPVELLKRDSRSRQHPDVQPDGPICVMHGTDTFNFIGVPEEKSSSSRSSAEGMVTAWRNHVRTLCPPATQPPVEPPALANLAPDACTPLLFLPPAAAQL